MTEPEAFGYCWHRSNGEFYYGIHLGTFDDGYVGSGVLFKKKFKGSDRSEWNRTTEFRGTFEECRDWEADMVTEELIETKLCLNIQTGGMGGSLTIEGRKVLSAKMKARMSTPEAKAWMSSIQKGKKLSPEHVAVIKDRMRGDGHPMLGRNHSEESIQKMRDNKAGGFTKGYKYPRVTCPHCNKTGGKQNMMRYHFNSCKEKDK